MLDKLFKIAMVCFLIWFSLQVLTGVVAGVAMAINM